MEAWVTVAVAFIVALSTLGATFLQNRHSNKRFEKELAKAREENQRKRRWEVRSEPLCKLRNELALMTFMQNRIIDLAEKQHTRYEEAKEKATEELYEAIMSGKPI